VQNNSVDRGVYLARVHQHLGHFLAYQALKSHEQRRGKAFDYVARIRPDTRVTTADQTILLPPAIGARPGESGAPTRELPVEGVQTILLPPAIGPAAAHGIKGARSSGGWGEEGNSTAWPRIAPELVPVYFYLLSSL
jgi:hypothetical protein